MLALASLLALQTSVSLAVDLTGSYSVFRTRSERNDVRTSSMQQQAAVDLFQGFTPFLSLRLGYQYFDIDTELFNGSELSRTSRQPRLELRYNRPHLSAGLTLQRSKIEGSSLQDSFKTNSLLAQVTWTPSRGPGYELSYQETTNLADVSVFGKDTKSRTLSFETFYDEAWWGVDYAFRHNTLDQREGNFGFDQNRHEVRAYVSRSIIDKRLSMNFSTTLTRLERSSQISGGADFADPVPGVDGLFVVDTTPEVGDLDSAPALIDGDTTTPAAPGIDIGGASTFRNVGLDLGIVAQVSRIEIDVDSLSQPNLAWLVFESPDNLNWQPVSGVISIFDGALLRYELRIPQTTNRYFKAVNVSLNSEPAVFVTEIRALVDVGSGGQQDRVESNLVRADLGFNFRPAERISGRVDAGFNTDQDVAAGLTRRDFRQSYAGARFTFELTDELHLNLGYRYTDLEVRRDPALLRTDDYYDASLSWTPIPAIDAVFSVQKREESDENRLLQSQVTNRGLLTVAFLPDLRLISDVEYVTVDDPFSGYERRGWRWRETLIARPVPRWTVRGSYGVLDFDTVYGPDTAIPSSLRKRKDYTLYTTWSPTALLVLSGSWTVSREDDRRNTRQSYSLAYNPGPKVNLTAVHQEYGSGNREIDDGSGGILLVPRETTSDSATLNYRLNNHLMTFGSFTRSSSTNLGIETDRVVSVRVGLRLYI